MDPDPWLWSANQVLNFFRHEAAAFVADRPNSRLPDLPAFLQVLEENEVDGPTLLDAVDSSFLKEDCGIKALKVRSTVIHCIQRLKARSRFINVRDGAPMPPIPGPVAALLQPLSSAQTPLPDPAVESSTKVRSGEIEVEDGRGRKRRRLNLMGSEQEQSATEQASQLAPQPALRTLLSTPSQPTGYLSDSGLPIDELYYGKTPIGQEIGKLPAGDDFVEGTAIDMDRAEYEEWQLNPTTLPRPAGEASYVHRWLCRFKNTEQRLIKRGGRDAIALLPYPEELVANQKAVSALVVRMDSAEEPARSIGLDTEAYMDVDGEPGAKAMRENAAYLEVEVDYTGMSTDATAGEWDFLVQRWRRADEATPEDDDFDQSSTSSLREEIAKDAAGDSDLEEEKRKYLSNEEVGNMIEQCINDMIDEWVEKKRPKLEAREWSIWRQTRQSRTERDRLVEGAKQTIRLLGQRLEKLTAEFQMNEWPSDGKQLREVCGIMSATVDDREEQKWKIQVWRSRKEPHHVVRHGQHSTSTSKPTTGANNRGFAVQPGDRISVEPALQNGADEPEEVYHTPHGSQIGDEDVLGADGAAGDDEMSVDGDAPTPDFIDDGEISLGEAGPMPGLTTASSPRNQASAPDTPGRKLPEPFSDLDSPTLPDISPFVKSSQLDKVKPSLQTPVKRPVVIEISSDSTTPASHGNKKKKALALRDSDYEHDPMLSIASEVKRWDMDDLVRRADRMRILIKLLTEMGPEVMHNMNDCLTRFRKPAFVEKILDSLRALMANNHEAGNNADSQIMIRCAKLYLAYRLPNPELAQNADALKKVSWQTVIHDKAQVSMFTDLLSGMLRKRDGPLFKPPKPVVKANPASEVSKTGKLTARFAGTISSDSESEEGGTPTKKQKRKKRSVKLGALAAQSQSHAFDRQKRFKARQEQVSNSQELLALSSPDASVSAVQINILKDDDQNAICVDPKIAQSIKEHQIAGVQFMWREITAEGEEGPQGCILAHTMGLGKTMQLITLLVALNEATQSDKVTVSNQLPVFLRIAGQTGRRLRVLVLAPPSLLANWRQEIKHWAGKKVGEVFAIEPSNKKNHLPYMENWHESGGILLIGYDMFRNQVNGRKVRNSDAVDVDRDAQRHLLEGPEIVVADEAHMLKNEKSGISMAVRQIKSESRIALTGTPMSNDVQEVYSLVSFAAPDYLGDAKWFRNQFAKPIKEGNSKDSTREQFRKGLKRLAVLHRKIEPKVNRADITVLRGSLSSKVEFVVFLPLSEVQRQAYCKYVTALLGDSKNDKASQTRIFSWLTVLALLTAHPLAFKRKLLAPPKKSRRQSRELTPSTSDSGASGAATPNLEDEKAEDEDEAGATIGTLGFSEETIQHLISGISDSVDEHLSAKMSVLMDIVSLSKRCGDKILVFSQGLGTLDYVELLLKDHDIRFARIDGAVPVAKRVEIVDMFAKDHFDVLIISTKAGNVGLNIQTANRVVILDFGFNPTYEQQAIGRAYRLGQEKPVLVYRLIVGGTFESHIYDKQMFKTSLTSRVIDKKSTKRTAEGTTREWLYEPLEIPQKDVEPFMKKDEAVLDRILDQQLRESERDANYSTLIRDLATMETLTEEVQDQPLNDEEKAEVEQEYLEGLARPRKGAMAVNGTMPPPSTAPVRRGRPPKNVSAGLPVHGLPSSAPQNGGIASRQSLTVRFPLPGGGGIPYPHPYPQSTPPSSAAAASNGNQPRMPHGLPFVPSTAPPGPR